MTTEIWILKDSIQHDINKIWPFYDFDYPGPKIFNQLLTFSFWLFSQILKPLNIRMCNIFCRYYQIFSSW